MRRIVVLLVASAATLSCAADPAGRWTGSVRIPGRELPVVIDLAQDAAGAWTGSMVLPGLGVKGAALGNIKIAGDDLSFDGGETLGSAPNNVTFVAHLDDATAITGQFRQGGNTAPFTLKRTGAAQVELARQSTAVARDTQGRWVGEYEMGGYPRHVTLEIANRTGGAANVDLVIVGKKTTQVPVDFVSEQEGMLRIESSAYRIAIEGRVHGDTGRIVGTLENGPIELPLTLRREGKPS